MDIETLRSFCLQLPGVTEHPAPYLAPYKWVLIENANSLSLQAWERYILHSYQLVRDKLPAKVKKQLNIG